MLSKSCFFLAPQFFRYRFTATSDWFTSWKKGCEALFRAFSGSFDKTAILPNFADWQVHKIPDNWTPDPSGGIALITKLAIANYYSNMFQSAVLILHQRKGTRSKNPGTFEFYIFWFDVTTGEVKEICMKSPGLQKKIQVGIKLFFFLSKIY